MKTFPLHLQSATQYERIDDVISFVGEDASGGFGIRAGHSRMMTVLTFGLARFRQLDRDWQFLALPEALVYFLDNQLYLSTRRYVRGDSYEAIRKALREGLTAEEEALRAIKQSVRRLEEEMFKRLWRMGRSREAAE